MPQYDWQNAGPTQVPDASSKLKKRFGEAEEPAAEHCHARILERWLAKGYRSDMCGHILFRPQVKHLTCLCIGLTKHRLQAGQAWWFTKESCRVLIGIRDQLWSFLCCCHESEDAAAYLASFRASPHSISESKQFFRTLAELCFESFWIVFMSRGCGLSRSELVNL